MYEFCKVFPKVLTILLTASASRQVELRDFSISDQMPITSTSLTALSSTFIQKG
jgi:hypothetical protein